jgi:hypothetical protein
MKLIIILILIIIISIGVFYLYHNNKNIETFVAPDPKYTALVDALRNELKNPGAALSSAILPGSNYASLEPESKPASSPGSVVSPGSNSGSSLSPAPVLTTTVTSTQTLTSDNTPVPGSKTLSLINFIAIVETFKPWGAYYGGNISEDYKLLDIFNRSNRDAVITGPIIKASAGGFGATNNVDYISGNTSTVVEWAPNSIPYNCTICSITRYTGNTNNKRILTAKDATPSNDWIHGHQSGKRGIVLHNSEYMVDNNIQIPGTANDWVVTCATTGGSFPGNVYINGVPSGVRTGGIGALQLGINKAISTNIISENSDFALSYVIIWDTALSNNTLKIISDNLLNYLSTGEPLLFDISSLNVDDKIKVQNLKSLLIQEETQNALNLLKSRMDTPAAPAPAPAPAPDPASPAPASPAPASPAPASPAPAAPAPASPAPASPPPTAGTVVTASGSAVPAVPAAATTPTTDEAKAAADAILLRAANLETILAGKEAVITTPTNNVINLNNQLLNNQAQTVRSSICTLVNKMPSPEMSSFTQDVVNIPLTSTNTADQSYLWCKCDGDDGINANTRECKMFDVCRKNYANNNKLDYKATFTTINTIDKQTYDSCIVVFENFPRYLDANTSNQNRPVRSI